MSTKLGAALIAASALLVLPAAALARGGGGGGFHGGGGGGGFHGGGGYGGGGYHGGGGYGGGGYHPASSGYRPAGEGYHPSYGGYHPASTGYHPAAGYHPTTNAFHPANNSGFYHGSTFAHPAVNQGFAGQGNFAHNNVINNAHVNNFGNVNSFHNTNMNWHQNYLNNHWGGYGGTWNGHGWAGWHGGYGGYGGYGYGGYGYGGYGYGGGFLPGLGLGLGMGLGAGMMGWGLSSWGMGAWPYSYGYASYSNPYYGGAGGVGGVGGGGYNYAQPLALDSPPPSQTVIDTGTSSFDAARASFLAGDYNGALQETDQAVASLPNDLDLHEFRALTLFALGRYNEAAAGLYAVLTAGPGWNWATLVGLYPNVDTFTAQLRTLEQFRNDNPTQAPPRFVLAYLYTSMGSNAAAAGELQQVVQLQPSDKLSAQLLAQLSGPPAGTAADGSVPPGGTPTATTQPPPSAPLPATMTGNWSANGADNTPVSLSLQPDGKFTWSATSQGNTRSFSGQYTIGNGLMTLVRDDGQPIVGRVEGVGDSGFRFVLAGGAANDPGLSFQR